MSDVDVVVLGGTGFLGSAVASRLDADVAGRDGGDASANILLREELGVLKQYDVVVNCVGLSPLSEPTVPYKAVHHYGPKNIVSVLDDQHLVHISAVGAARDSPITYLRTKGAGEEAVREAYDSYTILRPDVLYDPDSEAWRERLVRPFSYGVAPYVAKAVRPVHRGDVAEAVAHVVDGGVTGTYDVYGDEEISVAGLARRVGGASFVGIPESLWYPFFFAACELRIGGLSRDQRLLYTQDLSYEDRPDWFAPRSLSSS